MKLLIFVMGHLLNCFVPQLHNSIYVMSFYFQQQLIMSRWLFVLISEVPGLFKVTFVGTFARKVLEISGSLCLPLPFFSLLFTGERGCDGRRRELVILVVIN